MARVHDNEPPAREVTLLEERQGAAPARRALSLTLLLDHFTVFVAHSVLPVGEFGRFTDHGLRPEHEDCANAHKEMVCQRVLAQSGSLKG